MFKTADFSSLNIPIPKIIETYSIENQEEILNYLKEMTEHDRMAYLIAFEHLGSSFNIYKSNGFKEWKNKK
jgi:hypothetical protein